MEIMGKEFMIALRLFLPCMGKKKAPVWKHGDFGIWI
jgi:hypothetical protein